MTTAMTLEERILAEEAWDYLRQGRGDKAARTLARLGPTSPLYYAGLGYLYFLDDNSEAAEQNFRTALKESPGLSLAHIGLAQIYKKLGDEDRTFNELREVLKVDPENSWARGEYAILKQRKTELSIDEAKEALAQGDSEKGKEAYLKALHYSPESADIHLALAELYKKENKLSSALVHLKAATTSNPSNKDLWENYAETLAEAKQHERSLEAYEKVLELDPKSQKAQGQIEALKNKLGIYELPSRYNEIGLSEVLTREEAAALLAVKLKDVLPDPVPQPPIIIDIASSWASKFVLKVTALSFMDVYSNHTFQPRRSVTRAELAEILFRVIHYFQEKGHKFYHQIPPERIQIQDVTLDHFNYQPISQILSYQVMELFPDRTFRPDQALSGQEGIKTVNILLALIR